VAYKKGSIQPYPRESDFRARSDLFPKLDPPLSLDLIREAIRTAFERTMKDKRGENIRQIDTPQKLVLACLKHLKERYDPVLAVSFYSALNASEIFIMDEIPHEMQRYRMKIGLFYQYLLIWLAKKAGAEWHDGQRAGDAYADVKTPG
jgi:hypothetical protein